MWSKSPVATGIATFLGTGFLPFVPGTWGSAATVPVVELLFRAFGVPGIAAFAVAAGALGIPAATAVSERRGDGDPSQVVIDEVAGQAIALLPVYLLAPRERPLFFWGSVFAAFVLFRIIDILKPGPVRTLESLPGGLGVVADDVLGGAFAAILVGAGVFFLR